MKSFFFLLTLCLPLYCTGQDSLVFDIRDNQSYKVGEFNGQLWMIENLNIKTELSLGLSAEEQMNYPNISGRWYHMNELDNVCPVGWRLPTSEDWIAYFRHLSKMNGAQLTLKSSKENISITNFSNKFDLFEPGNPLNILHSGIFQGSNFIFVATPAAADYWIQDLPTKGPGKRDKTINQVKVSYPNASHIHLFNKFTNIHSHEHHLNPEEEETLRRFLVRCIYKDESLKQ